MTEPAFTVPNIDKDDMLVRYKQRLASELGEEPVARSDHPQVTSREYQEFRKEMLPTQFTTYEKWARRCGKLFSIKVSPDKQAEFEEAIRIGHLNITPQDIYALALIIPLSLFLVGGGLSIFMGPSMFFAFFSMLAAGAAYMYLMHMPFFLANTWRLKASNQMVLCVFYIVTYMRHTSNLELAIAFAADHVGPPLSLDLKKVLWDVETEKYDTVRDSLEAYLATWRKHNMEFIESLHLIESSLFEPNEARRQELLDKSLDVILQQTYEKMLRYAHDLKSPITTLHMLGIILPILGLVILPLIVSFMETVKWYHLMMLYNITLPIAVFYIGKNILSSRPTGYGDTDIAELNPELKKFQNIRISLGNNELSIHPAVVSATVGVILFLIAMTPLILHFIAPAFDIEIRPGIKVLDYRKGTKDSTLILGPYGIAASLISLLVPLAWAYGFGLYARLRSANIVKIREKSQRLEQEFASALFQLGNRLGDGVPAEAAFEKVANVMEETVSGQFFSLVSSNIRRQGMGLHDAIFHPKLGALRYFPSSIIDSSMRVLTESVRKGPKVASGALTNVSRYIKEIHIVNERLKDLMAEIISDMKSQISMLTPAIAGIVIGITSMITTIIGALSTQLMDVQNGEVASKIGGITELFGDGIPTFYFQIVVGTYLFQLIYILTVMTNGIENGADALGERYALGRNLIRSTLIYCGVSATVMLLFNMIAMQILSTTLSGT